MEPTKCFQTFLGWGRQLQVSLHFHNLPRTLDIQITIHPVLIQIHSSFKHLTTRIAEAAMASQFGSYSWHNSGVFCTHSLSSSVHQCASWRAVQGEATLVGGEELCEAAFLPGHFSATWPGRRSWKRRRRRVTATCQSQVTLGPCSKTCKMSIVQVVKIYLRRQPASSQVAAVIGFQSNVLCHTYLIAV